MRFPPYAPLTIPRNPLKRLFWCGGDRGFQEKKLFWFNSAKKKLILSRTNQRRGALARAPFARPLYRGRKRSSCADRSEVLAHFHYMYSALTEKILTTEIDKQKVWCCTTAGGGRRKGGEPPRKEAVRVRKSPYFDAKNKPILSRTN